MNIQVQDITDEGYCIGIAYNYLDKDLFICLLTHAIVISFGEE